MMYYSLILASWYRIITYNIDIMIREATLKTNMVEPAQAVWPPLTTHKT